MAERSEPILEPELPIIDPHHHLWDRPARLLAAMPSTGHGFEEIIRSTPRYLLDELLADLVVEGELVAQTRAASAHHLHAQSVGLGLAVLGQQLANALSGGLGDVDQGHTVLPVPTSPIQHRIGGLAVQAEG